MVAHLKRRTNPSLPSTLTHQQIFTKSNLTELLNPTSPNLSASIATLTSVRKRTPLLATLSTTDSLTVRVLVMVAVAVAVVVVVMVMGLWLWLWLRLWLWYSDG